MAWTNEELAARFREIAELQQLTGADHFRIRAYERAADAIAAARVDLAEVARGELAELPGIGASTAKKIAEYLDDGEIVMLADLRAKVPAGLRELTRVPGLGPKTAVQLHDRLGIDSIAALRSALEREELRHLPGLGAKTEQKLRESLRRVGAKDDARRPAADAIAVAEELVAFLRAVPEAEEVAYAGSLRRMRETVGDIDVLVASTTPAPVMDALRQAPLVDEVLASGETKTSVLTARGFQADVRVVRPDDWGAALVYFTGSKAHNVRIRERAVRRGLTLNEYGLHQRDDDGEVGARVASRTEADVYAALDLAEIPAPQREDTGEVEAAAAGTFPCVVRLEDLRGDLHGHSDWSGDGKASLAEMAAAAAERGYAYWAVTDHAEDLTMNGVSAARMRERRKVIAGLQESGDLGELTLLDGAELNIAIDGAVDYDPEFLLAFDWCVASVHTLMTRPQAEQTERILQAMTNPAVHAIGHPTGRKIGKRPGYELDFAAICDAARETGTALEVNASPRRLDLSGDLVRRAVEAGVTLTISCDAHAVGDLRSMRYGVATAQRGWATAHDVLNTRDLPGLRAFTAAKRERHS